MSDTIVQESRYNRLYARACTAVHPDDEAESWRWVYADNCAVQISTAPKKPVPSAEDLRIFRELVRQWYQERGSTSSISRMVNCESYRAIIGMGPKAIQLILGQLQQQPDFWFAALRGIVHEDPVPDDARGNMRRMTEAWLAWGVRNQYIEPVNGHRANGHI